MPLILPSNILKGFNEIGLGAAKKKNGPILLALKPGCCVAPSGEYPRYSPLEAPCIRAECLRNIGQIFFSATLTTGAFSSR
jgi:hypothetical protein